MNQLALTHPTKTLSEDRPLIWVLSCISGWDRSSLGRWLLKNKIHPDKKWIQLDRSSQETILAMITGQGDEEILLDTRVASRRMQDIRQLMRTKCYRGMRHKLNKRVRGQRTRTTNRVNRVLKGFQKKK